MDAESTQAAVDPGSHAKIVSRNSGNLYDFDLEHLASERNPPLSESDRYLPLSRYGTNRGARGDMPHNALVAAPGLLERGTDLAVAGRLRESTQ
jgi:hypothetical protein